MNNQEFTRAMFCPEVEAERLRAIRRVGMAEDEVSFLKKRFVFLDRESYYPKPNDDMFGVRVTFSKEQLVRFIGNWTDVRDFIWYAIGDQIMSLIGPSRGK